MAGDRDVAVAFARAWADRVGHRLAGWDVTAATGVRGLRLLNESRAFDRFSLTEANEEAARVLGRNALPWPGAVTARQDGRTPPASAPFDYVDIDPYGTPVPFVPTALAALRPGGVLAVTATDMMVLAGVQKGACERRYGAHPIRGRLSPEGGLRILLAYLARTARSRDRTIRPLLAYTRDHHVRAYVEVAAVTSDGLPDPVEAIDPATWAGPPLGERGPYGPLWLGPLFDGPLVRSLAAPRMPARARETERFIARLQEEVEADLAFYYESNQVAGELGLGAPPSLDRLLEALHQHGHRAARTHARPEGFRTDAPRALVESVARSLSPPP